MFTATGLILGLVVIILLLSLVDHISRWRGLGPVHPMSEAVALALLLGGLVMCMTTVVGMRLDLGF